MKRHRYSIHGLAASLLVLLVLAGCTTTGTETLAAQPSVPVESGSPAVNPGTPATVVETDPVATSRGSDLVATDPSGVELASGRPQLIEFFAFW